MDEINDYEKQLSDALDARRDWLEKTELSRLKETFRIFHSAFVALYKLFLKKGLIQEDPYKGESKIGELEIPDVSPFNEAEKIKQLNIRLSNYDNQLDFLVNFYQFNAEFLNMDRIKRILGLLKYIDWTSSATDRASPVTRAVNDLIAQIKNGADPMSSTLISESLANLTKNTRTSLTILKELTDFNRESYKFDVRSQVIQGVPAAEITSALIKKKFSSAMPGKPFYPDLIEEIVRENSAKEGAALREKVLKQLEVADAKQKAAKAPVSYKAFLMDGLYIIGSVASTLAEIGPKLDENADILADRKNSFWTKVKRVVQQMLNKDPDPVIYPLEYIDPVKGAMVKEKINFTAFRADMAKKHRNLSAMAVRGAAVSRLEAMEEDQLMGILDRAIRDTQSLQKTLSALDEYFKAESGDDREKIKGIKPELATMKNATISANLKRHEYGLQKEEEEQFKKLGIAT